VTLINSTLSGNTACCAVGGGSGAIDGGAAVVAQRTILANLVNCSMPVTSQGDNLSSDGSCFATNATLNDRAGTDPLLGALANNGGATQTHALLPGSPAIDMVLHNPCPPPATDQRGVQRPAGGWCDIGAVEAEGAPPPTPTPTPSPTATTTPAPSASPTPSPTASPSPTLSPTPTPSPTPSPSPSPTPAPTPSPTPSPAPTAKPSPPPTIQLTATASKVHGVRSVALAWSGPGGVTVVIVRNGATITPTGVTTTSYTDTLGSGSAANYTYTVCLAGTTACSNAATVRI
jgi:hypothetical protein